MPPPAPARRRRRPTTATAGSGSSSWPGAVADQHTDLDAEEDEQHDDHRHQRWQPPTQSPLGRRLTDGLIRSGRQRGGRGWRRRPGRPEPRLGFRGPGRRRCGHLGHGRPGDRPRPDALGPLLAARLAGHRLRAVPRLAQRAMPLDIGPGFDRVSQDGSACHRRRPARRDRPAAHRHRPPCSAGPSSRAAPPSSGRSPRPACCRRRRSRRSHRRAEGC